MKIWVIEIGEPLPIEEGVRLHRYGEFTKFLAKKGHEVTWWTSSFSHTPKKNFFSKNTDQKINDVKIKFIYGNGYPSNISLARFKHQQDFANKFSKLARKVSQKPDLIISPVPTIEGAYEGALYAKENNIPHVIDIRDYWPDELVNIIPKPFRFIGKLVLNSLYRKMNFICQNCHSIMGNSEISIQYGLKFAKRARSQNDYVFPLGYHKENLPEVERQSASDWYKDLSLKSTSFKVCFFGTIGRFFDLETVIATAKELKNANIEFILAGTGDKLSKFKEMSKGANNIYFPGWLNKAQITLVMENSHVGLAPYIPNHGFALPNKVFEYMAGGLPILSSIDNSMPEILKKHQAGLTYHAYSVTSLKDTLLRLVKEPALRDAMAKNSYLLYEKHFQTQKTFNDAEQRLIAFATDTINR